jgi:type II secretory pathway predicted ATPase ExeA
VELGLRPSHRRAELWATIKKTLLHLVDERGIAPVLILDEAQHLSDPFLLDLSGFLNFTFDSRDLLTLWLVGLPPAARAAFPPATARAAGDARRPRHSPSRRWIATASRR